MSDKRLVAVVDDHVMFRKGLIVLIDLFPQYEVILDVSNGKELIAQLNPNNLPDIILLDIAMPEMDGYATAEEVKVSYPQIKILALSTMEADTVIIRMIRAGARGYVLKDADPSELKRAFEEVMTIGYFYNENVTRKILKTVHNLADSVADIHPFSNLTDREINFLKYVCTELSYKEIAEKMFVSARTVEGYRDALCEKLQLKTRVGLAMYAIKNNIVQL